jgi:hypothetical protein
MSTLTKKKIYVRVGDTSVRYVNVVDLISDLQAMMADNPTLSQFELDCEQRYMGDDTDYFYVTGQRLETDEELAIRQTEQDRRDTDLAEARYAEYLKLNAEFGE